MSSIPVRDPTFVPSHVPPELVWPHDLNAFARTLDDPFQSPSHFHKGPEIVWTRGATRGIPGWVLTRHALIQEVFLDTAHFSSIHNTDMAELLGVTWVLNPFEIDPPAHMAYRQILQPHFTPAAIAKHEAMIRGIAHDLIAQFEDKGTCDFSTQFADLFPNNVFLELFGMPREMLPQFSTWEHTFIRGRDIGERVGAVRAIKDYMEGYMERRRSDPRDDIPTTILTAQIKGRPLDNGEIMGMAMVLYFGGLDTVLSSLGWFMLYLAKNPALQTRLRNTPADIPAAVEDFLRCYGATTTRRIVTQDIDFHGVPMKKGDRVFIPTYMAARDEREYPNPDVVDPDRKKRHLTLATGVHNCLGAHLARLEIKIVLEEFLSRFDNIRIPEGKKETWQTDGVWSVTSLPLVWERRAA